MSAPETDLVAANGNYVMTRRDAIVEAQKQVEWAIERRGMVLAEARNHGVTVRQLADLLGVSFNTVWRWSGGKSPGNALDEPVGVKFAEER